MDAHIIDSVYAKDMEDLGGDMDWNDWVARDSGRCFAFQLASHITSIWKHIRYTIWRPLHLRCLDARAR